MQNKTLQMKRAMRTALFVLLLSVAGTMKMYAYDFSAVCETGQTLYYSISLSDNSKVYVNYPGSSSNNPWGGFVKPTGALRIPDSVTNNGTTYSVVYIGMYAFKGCSTLSSVEIPSSVTYIADYAFNDCYGLTSVFYTGTIAQWCEISFSYSFSNSCSNPLYYGQNLYINNDLVTDLVIPEGVTYIGNYAFYSCKSLTSVEIPNSVTTIGDGAFYDCRGLTSLEIPDSVTFIGQNAFSFTGWYDAQSEGILYLNNWCLGYKGSQPTGSLSFHNGTKGIAGGAFYNCRSLTSVEIPNSVIYIGNSAFSNCRSLTSVEIPNSVISIGASAFYGCKDLTSVEIPDSVITIGYGAFWSCESLTSVTIGNSVTSIEDYAFCWCTKLTSVEIPDSVITIGAYAFQNCASLTSVTIGNSVTSIEDYAFHACGRLLSIIIKATVPPSLGTNVFQNVPNNIPIVVPYGTLAAYQSAQGWSTFTHFIESEANPIEFADANVEAICLAHWDTNGTGQLSLEEAAAVTDLGRAFTGNTEITSFDELQYFTGLSSIGYCAFYNCSGLVSLTIPNAVTHIDDYAFTGTGWYNNQSNGILYLCNWCLGYKGDSPTGSLIIQSGTKGMADHAFYNCSGLNSVFIPNSVSSIGNYVFAGCSGLSSVIIPNSATTIGDYAFNECTGLSSITIGNSVSKIGSSAFCGCSGLTSVTIPNSVNSIGASAFIGCSRLTTFYYNAKNADITQGLFGYETQNGSWINGCPNLTTLHIGADVEEIGDKIFKGCTGIHLVMALGSTPAILDGNALTDIAENSILMVSCGKRLTYFSVWNMFDFNNIMEDCGQYPIGMNNIGAGGSVSASSTQAQMGQEVQLTVTPNAGMVLSSLTVCNTSDPTQTFPVYPIGKGNKYGFIMPPYGVSIRATFVAETSVEENDNVPVSVYPNPTHGNVKIEAEGLKHITISNLLGQTVYNSYACGDAFEYDFSNHKAGIYLIRIETENGVVTKKVTVER